MRTNGDAHSGPRSARFYRHIGHTDIFFEEGRGRAAGNAACFLSVGGEDGAAIAGNEALLHLEPGQDAAYSALLLASQRVAAQEIALIELADPSEVRFPDGSCVVQFVTVKAHTGLEPQGVAGAEATRDKSVSLAGLQQIVPHFFGVLRREVQFEAILAGVAGSSDEGLHAIDLACQEPIVFQRRDRRAGETLHNAERPGPLHGKLRISLACVLHLSVEAAVAVDVVEVLILVAGIHAKQIMAVGNLVHEQVIDKRPRGSHQAGILRLAIDKPGGVVAGNELHQVEGLRAADLDFAHVADVKKAGRGARGDVFAHDSGIFDGHIPAAKIDHLGAHAAMHKVESRLAELRGRGFDHGQSRFNK